MTPDPEPTPEAPPAAPPPATGARVPWAALPAELRTAIERHLGAGVREADDQPGGFSPGVASRLRLAA